MGVQLADGFSELRLCWGTVKVSVENTGLEDSVPEFRKLQVYPGRKSYPGTRHIDSSRSLRMVTLMNSCCGASWKSFPDFPVVLKYSTLTEKGAYGEANR